MGEGGRKTKMREGKQVIIFTHMYSVYIHVRPLWHEESRTVWIRYYALRFSHGRHLYEPVNCNTRARYALYLASDSYCLYMYSLYTMMRWRIKGAASSIIWPIHPYCGYDIHCTRAFI